MHLLASSCIAVIGWNRRGIINTLSDLITDAFSTQASKKNGVHPIGRDGSKWTRQMYNGHNVFHSEEHAPLHLRVKINQSLTVCLNMLNGW